ncbi:uncharacterized protein LOC125312687 [Rhodamnia argentea]|uniref:Uncharacterized protein LOC125312687 n=1 Tax=Rhodamnia argentea TaxID=178133 RepID=A0ABM3GTK2_9MYRT|nr:uncharacterized protein LOC125312687 [Rhodamnia argentea]
MPVRYGDNVLGGMYGDHCALNGTAAVASMGSPVQALSLHSINQSEFLTHASSEQPMSSNCCLPIDPLRKCEQGASPLQNQGCVSLLRDPASSSSPDLGGEMARDGSTLLSVAILAKTSTFPSI